MSSSGGKFKGFLVIQDMGLGHSNAYHPQWDMFEMHWIAVTDEVKALKESWRPPRTETPWVIKGTYAGVIKGTYDGGHHADLHESQSRISKDESHLEYAPPSVGADSIKKKRGFSERGYRLPCKPF